MKQHPTQRLAAPNATSTETTWIYTDGESVELFPLPGATECVQVVHPPASDAPAGISLATELKSFGRHFFRIGA